MAYGQSNSSCQGTLQESKRLNRDVFTDSDRSNKQDWCNSEELRRTLLADLRTNASLCWTNLNEAASLSVEQIGKAIAEFASKEKGPTIPLSNSQDVPLPRSIRFPYSRHSSYEELCDFVKAFRPQDVYPCTVDETTWHEGASVEALFGQYCSQGLYRHDVEMKLRTSTWKNTDVGARQIKSEASTQSNNQESEQTDTTDSGPEQDEDGTLSIEKSLGSSSHAQAPETRNQNRTFSDQDPSMFFFLRRNDQGRLRRFDSTGKETPIVTPTEAPQTLKRTAEEKLDVLDPDARQQCFDDAGNEVPVPLFQDAAQSSYGTALEELPGPYQKRRKLDNENSSSDSSTEDRCVSSRLKFVL